MSTKQSKQIVLKNKGQPKKRPSVRPRLVFEEPHIFRAKSAQSLLHLQESREFLPCAACITEGERRQGRSDRPHSSYSRQPPARSRSSESRPSTGIKKQSRSRPSAADLERLSRPKTIRGQPVSHNCNWNNFIKKKTIKTPYALCDLAYDHESSETRPPFVNYGGRYDDKHHGEKRTFNSLAIHQLKHHEHEEERLSEVLRERRLRLQAKMYFREMEERRARAQELHDRAARASTEYRDNYRPPFNYDNEGTFSRH
ncbi:unnamed protein product [Rotaria magnacalcarata]|uniref:Uncharacterized protein n=1 Tax=Rotaria magnacalcarata TaxID=392030 RepID=A0A819MYV0_9BILA|nr:unnamed protein product [Rotaria magnacalcarata]CAF3986631.1 unnamed protein product [Rotaria magnacalcarata]